MQAAAIQAYYFETIQLSATHDPNGKVQLLGIHIQPEAPFKFLASEGHKKKKSDLFLHDAAAKTALLHVQV